MNRYFTGRMDGPQANGNPHKPIAEANPGDTFIIESTVPPEEKKPLGPLYIKGVKPGDIIAIHIEDIKITKWWGIELDFGMLPEIQQAQRLKEIGFKIPMGDKIMLPGNIPLTPRPMIGTISLASREQRPNPWSHGGNMDINEIRKGATLYIQAQREGGLLAVGDLHAYQGDGEIAGSAIESNGEVTLSVGITDKYPAPNPLIEIENRLMTVGMGLKYWDAVKTAVRDMTYLLKDLLKISLEEANSVAVQAGSLRNGAIWMMTDHPYVTMESNLHKMPRVVFLDLPLQ